jgi:hypothetical protein
LTLRCKNPRENRTELWFRFKASDHLHTTYFPADSSQRFVLTQAFDTLKTAPLTLGETKYKWDLIGFPSSDQTPVTLDQLSKVHSGFSFKAFVWNTSDQTYQNVDPLSPLTAGKGLWLAANKPIKTLELPAMQTAASDTNGQFQIKLHPGWNMVSNPSLATLWWPISQADLLKSPATRVHALAGFTASISNYSPSDSLDPWRGYFVDSKLPPGKDTVITLLRKKPVGTASKKSAHSIQRANDQWYLSLGEENHLALTLGSYAGTQTSVGPEDESVLASPDGGGPRLHSQRDGHQLQEDFVNGSPNEIHRFSLGFGSLDKTVNMPPVHVWSSELGQGQEAWAWLPRLGLRQQIVPGNDLSWWSSSSDSLQILVGTSNLLMQYPGFTTSKPSPSTFHCSLVTGHNNSKLRLVLTEATEVRVVGFRPNGIKSNLLRPTLLGIGEQNLDLYPGNIDFIQVLGQPASGTASWSQLLRF